MTGPAGAADRAWIDQQCIPAGWRGGRASMRRSGWSRGQL